MNFRRSCNLIGFSSAEIRCSFWVAGLLFCVGILSVGAHEVSSVSLISSFQTEEGRYELDAAMEIIPSDDEVLNDQISPEDAAREFATEYLTLLFDEEEVFPEMKITVEKTSDEDTPVELQREQVIVKLTGAIPPEKKDFLLYLDPSCPMAVVMVVVKDDRPARRMQVVLAGEYSRPVNILPVIEGDPFAATKKGRENEKDSSQDDPIEKSSTESPFDSAVILGLIAFFHPSLLPIFFVISLFLLSPRRKPVFLSIASLLIGLSLAVALLGWQLIGPLPGVVEVSGVMLAFLGVEVLLHRRFRWWRVVLFGAAGFTSGILLSATEEFRSVFFENTDAESFTGLISFVLGAELAAVAVGVCAGLILKFLYRFDWYQRSVVQPLAVLFTGFGFYLLISAWI